MLGLSRAETLMYCWVSTAVQTYIEMEREGEQERVREREGSVCHEALRLVEHTGKTGNQVNKDGKDTHTHTRIPHLGVSVFQRALADFRERIRD